MSLLAINPEAERVRDLLEQAKDMEADPCEANRIGLLVAMADMLDEFGLLHEAMWIRVYLDSLTAEER